MSSPPSQPPSPGQMPYPTSGPQQYSAPPAARPRKRRRIFLWFFLAVQVIFIIWLITGGVAADHNVTHCVGQYCKGATEAGSAIGIGLIVVFLDGRRRDPRRHLRRLSAGDAPPRSLTPPGATGQLIITVIKGELWQSNASAYFRAA
jgi:hypothetical protein